MKCTICNSVFKLTTYNKSSICTMCSSGLDSEEHQSNYHKEDDIAFELSILVGTGRTAAVFDSDQHISDDYNDYDDYGHGL